MKDALATRWLPRTLVVFLVALLALAVAPHARHLSPWLSGFFFILSAWRLAAVWRPALLPGRWLLFGLVLLGLANVLANVGAAADGRRGGVTLLVAMLGLKLLELRTRRDLYMTVFLGYFVVVTQFLFDQSLWTAGYLALVVVGLTGVLTALNRADAERSLRADLRLAVRLLFAAMPAAAVLFVVFPRLANPLWTFSAPQHSAVTGISDRMAMGSIGQLARSEAVAFRVRFDGEVPPSAARYWRGPVLWFTDGLAWDPGIPQKEAVQPGAVASEQVITYEMTVEPTRQRWLFPLELPVEVPGGARLDRDQVMTAREPLDRRFTYRGASAPAASIEDLSAEERARALQLPDNVTPRMRALVRRWQTEAAGAAELASAALDHFRRQPFVYTLQPPLLGAAPDDEFLFDTRAGFCEHYASSFAVLMRLAGVPARIVTGYQGGEYNPRGDHFMVRQQDAHAWAEIWVEARGWLRVDPTSAVAPERVERSIAPYAAGAGAPIVFRVPGDGALFRLVREARWLVDSLELGWHRWVVGFDEARQRSLFEDLGLGELRGYAQGLAAVAIAAVALLAGGLMLRLQRRPAQEPVSKAYARLKRKLSRCGMVVEPWLGPRELQRHATAVFPEHSTELGRIFDLYVSIYYGPERSAAQVRRLRRAVWRLHLKRRRVKDAGPATVPPGQA